MVIVILCSSLEQYKFVYLYRKKIDMSKISLKFRVCYLFFKRVCSSTSKNLFHFFGTCINIDVFSVFTMMIPLYYVSSFSVSSSSSSVVV